MIIDCISDLHGEYPELEGGDLLIVAGDLTARHTEEEALGFIYWLSEQDYEEKIVIAGNHDEFLMHDKKWFIDELECISKSQYLCDSGTKFEGLKIWGSPWTAQFPGINPRCCAFTVKQCDYADELLNEYWNKIPENIDILITHSPPYGVFDYTRGEYVGSKSLRDQVFMRIKPKLHVFGHIHECGGRVADCVTTKFVNASIMNEDYDAVNKPVRVIL